MNPDFTKIAYAQNKAESGTSQSQPDYEHLGYTAGIRRESE